MHIQILEFYDCQCSRCGRTRSEDFAFGMPTNKQMLLTSALKEGWRSAKGETLCPDCAGTATGTRVKADAYFDTRCTCCGLFWSTDFSHQMAPSRSFLRGVAYSEGWKCRDGLTYCPDCLLTGKFREMKDREPPPQMPDLSSCETISVLELLRSMHSNDDSRPVEGGGKDKQ